MTRQYSPKNFIRKVPPVLLSRFLRERGLTVPISSAIPTAEDIEQTAAALNALATDQAALVESDLVRVNDLACSGGFAALIEEARFRDIDLVAQIKPHSGAYAAAMWAFLNEPEMFEVAGAFQMMDRYGGWTRHRVGAGLSPRSDARSRGAFSGSLVAEFAKKGRSGPCQVDVWRRQDPDRSCYFAYPVDYPSTELQYGSNGGLERRLHHRVAEAIFVYRPGDGVLELHAHGNQQHKNTLATAFCRHVLGLDDLPPAVSDVFRLQPILRADFPPSTETADNVRAVEVKELKLERSDRGTKVILIAKPGHQYSGDTARLVRDTLNQHRWPIDTVRPTYAKLTFVFAGTGGQRDKRLTFTVTCPDRCSLRDDPYDQIAKKYLRQWGIAPD